MAVSIETVRAWMEKAQADLESARVLLGARRPLVEPACFHCQQCVEKLLKGFLRLHGIEAPKIHALNILFDMAVPQEPKLDDFRGSCEELTSYAVVVRDPIDIAPSREDAQRALTAAESLYDFLVAAMPPEARP